MCAAASSELFCCNVDCDDEECVCFPVLCCTVFHVYCGIGGEESYDEERMRVCLFGRVSF